MTQTKNTPNLRFQRILVAFYKIIELTKVVFTLHSLFRNVQISRAPLGPSHLFSKTTQKITKEKTTAHTLIKCRQFICSFVPAPEEFYPAYAWAELADSFSCSVYYYLCVSLVDWKCSKTDGHIVCANNTLVRNAVEKF